MRPSSAARLQPQLIIEHRYVRDFPVPISAADYEMETGWRCIPVPPTEDSSWEIFDRSKDRKTGWRRVRIIWNAA
jgi:hypothetical protein